MKQKRSFLPLLAIAMASLFLSGCKTPRVDWDARVGHYTYDQAVLEMGPPDGAAVLTDGTLVADWLNYRGTPPRYHALPSRYSYTYLYEPGFPDRYRRLTFSPEGVLQSWRPVTK